MKSKFIELCGSEESIPIFFQPYWLDTMVGEKLWDVVIVEEKDIVVGAWPFVKKRKYFFNGLVQPALTQYLGPWVRKRELKDSKNISYEYKIIEQLIERLPIYDFFEQNINIEIKNWLPFYWTGFSQTTKYTYRISCSDDIDMIWENMDSSARRSIRKATKNNIKIKTDLDFNIFWDLNQKVFDRQSINNPYPKNKVFSLHKTLQEKNKSKLFLAQDEYGRFHAGVYIVWDNEVAYYILGGGDPELRSSGATSLCFWHAIKFASSKGLAFDFEGSMIKPIEKFFRSFGGKQLAYSHITHSRSKYYQKVKLFKDLFW